MSIPVTEHVKAALLAESSALAKDSDAWALLAEAYEINDVEETHLNYLNAILTAVSETMEDESEKTRIHAKEEEIPPYDQERMKNAREQLEGSQKQIVHAEEMASFWEEKLDEAWVFEKEKKRRIRGFKKVVRAWEKSEDAWEEAVDAWEKVVESNENVD